MSDQSPPAGGSVFCTSCGYKLDETDRFCPECGASRPSAPIAATAPLTPPPVAAPETVSGSDVPPPPPIFPPAGIGGTAEMPPSPPPGYPAAPFPAGVPTSPFAAGVGTSLAMHGASSEPGDLLFNVEYPDHLSRLLIFVKWLLAIPHYIVLSLLGLVAYYLVLPIAFVCILITGRYPIGLWNFSLGVLRWGANVNAYLSLQRDEYPPFSMDPRQYPVQFEMEYPPRLSRLLIFVKWLLVIPSALVLWVVTVAGMFVLIVAWFAILFTGRFPQGMFGFVTGIYRWSNRVAAYSLLMTDKYPGFSLE